MSERKPNNLPWIILGLIGGFVFLGLFGFGIYSGAKAVTDEMSITIPEMPQADEMALAKNKLTVFVTAENKIFLGATPFKTVDELKESLLKRDKAVLDDSVVILVISEDATHKMLVSVKGMLDDMKLRSVIQLQRNEAN